MAAGFLSPPGTQYGPCIDEICGHTDCKATRDMAAAICPLCGHPIGYDRRFYKTDNYGLVHDLCLEEAEGI